MQISKLFLVCALGLVVPSWSTYRPNTVYTVDELKKEVQSRVKYILGIKDGEHRWNNDQAMLVSLIPEIMDIVDRRFKNCEQGWLGFDGYDANVAMSWAIQHIERAIKKEAGDYAGSRRGFTPGQATCAKSRVICAIERACDLCRSCPSATLLSVVGKNLRKLVDSELKQARKEDDKRDAMFSQKPPPFNPDYQPEPSAPPMPCDCLEKDYSRTSDTTGIWAWIPPVVVSFVFGGRD